MRGRASASIALSTSAFALIGLIGLFGLAGCYAKSVPMAPRFTAAPSSETPASRPTLLAGVRSATHGDNIERIDPGRVSQRIAERLYAAGVFSDVVYPLTERSPAVPDIVFEISVSSTYDLHPVSNLAKDIAVGLSVLLLQPVLPTVYNLEVELAANASMLGGAQEPKSESELRGVSNTRFEFTWLRAPKDSITQWHRKATERAIDELVARIADRYGARPAAGNPGS